MVRFKRVGHLVSPPPPPAVPGSQDIWYVQGEKHIVYPGKRPTAQETSMWTKFVGDWSERTEIATFEDSYVDDSSAWSADPDPLFGGHINLMNTSSVLALVQYLRHITATL